MKRKSGIIALLAVIALIFGMAPMRADVAYAAAPAAADNLSYTLTDINGKTVSTNNAGAKLKILAFGRVTCPNTRNTLESITHCPWITRNDIEVMFVEEGNATEEGMQEFVQACCCDEMTVCPTEDGYGAEIMWEYCGLWGHYSSVTFPVIFLIDENNKVRRMLTGAQSALGLILASSSFTGFDESVCGLTRMTVEVTCGQTEARSMFADLNARRTGSNGKTPWCWNEDNTEKLDYSGRTALKYDYNLEKAAMQRAAEIAVSYGHYRPSGERCFTAYNEVDGIGKGGGENIAAGQKTAEEVLDAWWEENEDYDGQGHRRNILDSDFGYIGIGHVVVNGKHFWVQEFTVTEGSTTETSANNSKTYFDVLVDADHMSDDTLTASRESINIQLGTSRALPKVTETVLHAGTLWGNEFPILNTKEWTSEDPSVAAIENGRLAGKSVGTTVITREAQFGGAPVGVSVTVTEDPVTDPDDPDDPVVDPDNPDPATDPDDPPSITDIVPVPVTVEYGQTAARQVFDELNNRRTGRDGDPWCWNEDATEKVDYSGRTALQYDYALEQVAMKRAAEVSIFYMQGEPKDHLRPNGRNYVTAFSETEGAGSPVSELFLTGCDSVDELLDEWWEENETTYEAQAERRTILMSDAKYAGVARATRGGYDFWVIELASTGGTAARTEAVEGERTLQIPVYGFYMGSDRIITDTEVIRMKTGENVDLPSSQEWLNMQMCVFAGDIPIDNQNQWVIDNTDIAEISGGKIVAKSAGSTVMRRDITYPFKGDAVEIPVIVRASDTPEPGDDPVNPDVPAAGMTDISGGGIELYQTKFTYTGSYKEPMVDVFLDDEYLGEGWDYTVSYSNNKKVGKATVTVTGIGDYTGTLTAAFTIVPKKTSVTGFTPRKKAFTVKWKKQAVQTTGYQIRYSLKSTMKSAKTVAVSRNRTLSKTIKGLKAGKKYYVQVRTYKKIGTKKYCSNWSTKRSVRTR